jgi:hypothetical protein
VAVAAVVAEVAVAALPVISIPQVPDAPPPVVLGTLRLVLAVAASDAPVPPLAIGTAFTKPSVASSWPAVLRLLASWDRL